MADALRARDVSGSTADLTGMVGAAIYGAAYEWWAASPSYRSFADLAQREFDRTVLAAIDMSMRPQHVRSDAATTELHHATGLDRRG
jgi:hypothetical protein